MAYSKLTKTKRIFFTIATLFLSVILLELSMIVLEPFLFKGMYQYDPDIGFRVRPYASGSNKFGFNDRDYSLNKKAGTYRILVLSDSFNWAGGRNNYTELLEKKFEEYYGEHRVDVINAGYPMTHTGEQLSILKKFGLQYNPDLVILGFFAGNDFIDGYPNRKRVVVNDTLFDIDRRKELKIFNYLILPRSRLYHFIMQKYTVLKELMAKHPGFTGYAYAANGERKGTFTENTFLNIEMTRLVYCNLTYHNLRYFTVRENYIFKSLSEMEEILKERKIKFIVSIFPDQFQVDKDLLNKLMSASGQDINNFNINLMQIVLKRFLDAKEISYIDMLSEFRSKNKETKLYKFRDTHWNAAGNQLAANILFKELLNNDETLINMN